MAITRRSLRGGPTKQGSWVWEVCRVSMVSLRARPFPFLDFARSMWQLNHSPAAENMHHLLPVRIYRAKDEASHLLYSMGKNNKGQLGIGDASMALSLSPVLVQQPTSMRRPV